MGKLLLTALVFCVVLALTAAAAAIEKNMELRTPAKVGGKQLEAKTYRIKIMDDGKLIVRLDREVVAEAEGEWVETKSKADGDTFIVEGGNLKEIRIGGRTKVWKAK
ncbi:MAG TPA: hypothetical protein VNL38_00835 [Candidatus Nitrosotenuis sp.]|nr:hypothetical protein [Candidatus Nitrosotenuis sp.]